MPSRRVEVLVLASAITTVALLVAVAAAFLAFVDDVAPGIGDRIAYSCKEPRNDWYAICVVRSEGGEPRQLTSRLATTDPAWSPDGRRIAFTRNQDLGEYTTFTADDVFVMDADGSDLRQLTTDEEGRASGQPAWSPDGREIVFVHGLSVASSVGAATALRFGDLLVMRADGSERRTLTRGTDASPAWSPDGSEIAFVRGYELNQPSGGIDLYVVDAAGGTRRRLTSTPEASETAPAWSPDGEWIAFVRATDATPYDGKAAIFIVRRDGTDERKVLEYRYYSYTSYGLTWSPDGQLIAFETSFSPSCTGVAVVSARGGAVRKLTECTGPQDSALAPAWQPDAGAASRG